MPKLLDEVVYCGYLYRVSCTAYAQDSVKILAPGKPSIWVPVEDISRLAVVE